MGMGKEIGPTSRLASYIDTKIANEIRNWVPSIKPGNYERALMVNTVLDLYHAKSIEELTGFTKEIECNNKPMKLPLGVTVTSLTSQVTRDYNKIKETVQGEPTQDKIRELIIKHRIANPLGVARFSFSLQMTTFGNYCEKIFGDLILTKLHDRHVETHIAQPKYL